MALARWFNGLEHSLICQKVASSISGQSTYLGCGFDSPVGGHMMFLSPSLSHFLSLNNNEQLWLVLLNGFGAGLQTKRFAGSIPSQGTCLGCGPGPQLGACERQLINVSLIHQCFSYLSFSLPSRLSKNK